MICVCMNPEYDQIFCGMYIQLYYCIKYLYYIKVTQEEEERRNFLYQKSNYLKLRRKIIGK